MATIKTIPRIPTETAQTEVVRSISDESVLRKVLDRANVDCRNHQSGSDRIKPLDRTNKLEQSFREYCLNGQREPRSAGRCLIVAEVAQAHDGSLGTAHAFIDAIANAGADAVKFQTHIADEESTPSEPWRVKFSRQDASRYDYWKRMEFTKGQWRGLKEHADERGILFMSSPFSEAAIDLLSEIEMRVWKVASGEIGNVPLLNRIAATGDPVIISSGMSDLKELDDAVDIFRRNGNRLAVLQCTSAYPCPPEQIGLNVLNTLRERYQVPVGLSDHSGKTFAGLAAVTLGSEVLEVHVTFSGEMFGPDIKSSITTNELANLVEGCRHIERMIDSPVEKGVLPPEIAGMRKMFTKSLVAGSDLAAGTILTSDKLKLKKPGNGMSANELPALLGRRLSRDVRMNDPVMLQDLSPEI